MESRPDKLSGAWVFVGTRVPLIALYENLAAGATIEEFLDWFPGVEEWKVKAVLQHEAKSLGPTPSHTDPQRRVSPVGESSYNFYLSSA